jgi:hypothetical protein
MPRRLLLQATARTHATPHPRHGPRRTICCRSNSAPSQDSCTAHHQGIHPGIGPQSPILFVPQAASRAILRVLLTDSTCPVRIPSEVKEGGEPNHCSKFVVVSGSERFRTETNASGPERCNCLKNIVKSAIFRTGQKRIQDYESAALTAELQARIV